MNMLSETKSSIDNMILILIVVLIIFYILYKFVYNPKLIVFDNDMEMDMEMKMDMNYLLLDNNKKMLIKKLETFGDDIYDEDGINNLEDIVGYNAYINSNLNPIISNINNTMDTVKTQRQTNKNNILNILSNIYLKRYIEIMNKQNAESYKMFLKYQEPKTNKYYQAYL